MASIPGSHFIASTSTLPVNVVETSGGALPPPKAGEFNLEVWTGNPASAPTTPAQGYQGLAVLSHSGQKIDLIAGAFAITDQGNGQDTINAKGDQETISGGTANVTLNLFGNNDVANGGGSDTISVFGQSDIVNGAGNDLITVFGDHDSVDAGTGNDTITTFGDHETITASSGNEVINVFGDHSQVTAGTGNDTINLFADHAVLTKSSGNETVNVFGSHDSIGVGTGNADIDVVGDGNTVAGGLGNETVQVIGDDNVIDPAGGLSNVSLVGSHDTVGAGDHTGFSLANIGVVGDHFRFNDGLDTYFDTITGFDQSAGDRIHLTTESVSDALAHSQQVNGGHDTLITLDDGSTILLKGVNQIDHSFFG
ncbi:MAG TPA: hypothetical protein VM782_07685 [Stellaceae bacterium]|nr:hypothetical protein [Stellaceae bacterium]